MSVGDAIFDGLVIFSFAFMICGWWICDKIQDLVGTFKDLVKMLRDSELLRPVEDYEEEDEEKK